MTEEQADLMVKFCGAILKYSKQGKIRVQAKYKLPAGDDPLWGWLFYADWVNKKGKHKYFSIILEEK